MTNSTVSNQENNSNNFQAKLPSITPFTNEERMYVKSRCHSLAAYGENIIENLFFLKNLSTETKEDELFSLDVQKVFAHIVVEMNQKQISRNEVYLLFSLFLRSNLIVDKINELNNNKKITKLMETTLYFPASLKNSVGKESSEARTYRLMGAMMATISKAKVHSKIDLFCEVTREFQFCSHYPSLINNLISLETAYEAMKNQGLVGEGEKFDYSRIYKCVDENINTTTKKSFASLSEKEINALREILSRSEKTSMLEALKVIFDDKSAEVLHGIFSQVVAGVIC